MFGRLALVVALLHGTAHADSPWTDQGAPLPIADANQDDEQYRALTNHDRTHYLRVFVEEMAALGVGVFEYWLDRNRAITNFDYPSLLDRFTFKAWRFDNNGFQINFIGHPLNGMSFHTVGRSNGMSLWGSMLVGFATSMTWEYGWEFREKVSINDVMVTTAAGATMGEWVHWIGKYLDSAPAPRSWHRFARWTIGLPDALHGAMDGRKGPRKGTTADALGFSSDIWHRFDLSAGTVRGNAELAPDLRADTELVALPGFLRAGHTGRFFADANVASLKMRVSSGSEVGAIDIDSDTLLLGVQRQAIDETGGATTLVGVDLGFRFAHERFGDFKDRLSQLHFPGLGIDQYVIGKGVTVRARARLNVDFAGVHAASYAAYKAAHPDGIDKTILRKQGYYFAWGASTRLDLELRTRYASAGVAFRYGRYDSQEGYDRNQEDVTDDVDAHDTMRDVEGWVRVSPTGGRLYVEGRASQLDRDGSVGDQTSDQRLRRLSLSLGVSL